MAAATNADAAMIADSVSTAAFADQLEASNSQQQQRSSNSAIT